MCIRDSAQLLTKDESSASFPVQKTHETTLARCREVKDFPLPCQLVYVLKPDSDKPPGPKGPAMKYKSKLVICGSRQPWEQDESTATNNLDAPLLRWMLSAFRGPDVTWCSVDISTAFLTADIPPEQLVLLKPPKSVVELKVVEENQISLAVTAVYDSMDYGRL
eukprot:3282814-Amphidinium_carterae.1